ncbi:MAG TPA: RNA polymerase sigma factor, partial [Firmicutes bacterium]|nr:RNA polymerase sigma factor [Bacillota bacterium]
METSMIAIITAAKEGDTLAFSKLYETVWNDLYRYAYYLLRVREDAEDAVQECAFEAYKGIHGLKSEEAFKGWIFSILYRVCKRKLKEYVQKNKSIALDEMEELRDVSDLEQEAGNSVTLHRALDQLAPDDRLIVMLSVVGGYSGKEIAAILHKPHGTVRSRLSRALAKLRTILEEP